MLRYLGPLIFGVAGVAVLIGLCVWQIQRLGEKQTFLTDINARIDATPVAVPASPDPEADRFLPVRATGQLGEEEIHVLVSQKRIGAGYRILTTVTVDGRVLLLDRGFVLSADKDLPRSTGDLTVEGNLHWPDEIDSFTPEPDTNANIWFARDVPRLAEALGAEPVLIIARATSDDDPRVTPLPVDTSGIPNDHLQYAITWFLLAIVWATMTGYLIWRMARAKTPESETS